MSLDFDESRDLDEPQDTGQDYEGIVRSKVEKAFRIKGFNPSLITSNEVADFVVQSQSSKKKNKSEDLSLPSYLARSMAQLVLYLAQILKEGRDKFINEELKDYVTLNNLGSKNIQKLAVPSIGLPAMFTCPGKSEFCRVACYASRNRYGAQSTIISRFRQLLATFTDEFWQNLPKKLGEMMEKKEMVEREAGKKNVFKDVRLHDSGDFFLLSSILDELYKDSEYLWEYLRGELYNGKGKAPSSESLNIDEVKKAIEELAGKPFDEIRSPEELGDIIVNAFKRAVEILSGKPFDEIPDDYYVRKWGEVLNELEKMGINVYTYTRAWRVPELWESIKENLLPHKNFALMLSVDKTMPEEELRKAEEIRNEMKELKKEMEEMGLNVGYNVDIASTGMDTELAGMSKKLANEMFVCPASVVEAVEKKAEKSCGEKCRYCFMANRPVLFVMHR